MIEVNGMSEVEYVADEVFYIFPYASMLTVYLVCFLSFSFPI